MEVVGSGYDVYDGRDRSCTWGDFQKGREGPGPSSASGREALLDEFERSGGSAAQFAAYVGLRYSTFANWVNNRRRQRSGQQLSRVVPNRLSARGWKRCAGLKQRLNAVGMLCATKPLCECICQVAHIWKWQTGNKACLPPNFCTAWAG